MADDQTPPAGGRGRKIPVPMPILIGLVVAIGAGIYLMRRNAAKTAAAAQAGTPGTSGQQPIVVQGGGGPGSGYLYSLLQNLQSSPGAATQPAGKSSATVTALAGPWGPGTNAQFYSALGQPGGAYNSNTVAGYIPAGTSVQFTGPAVQGAPGGLPGSPVTTYYPVTYNGKPGYISSANLANV